MPQQLEYEREKIKFLQSQCVQVANVVAPELSQIVHEGRTTLLDLVEDLLDSLEMLLLRLSDDIEADVLWKEEEEMVHQCKLILTCLKECGLPRLKSRIIDLVDAGPGMGISYHAVGYRTRAEFLICGWHYYIRLHLAPGDSSNNEVEKFQSCVGDAVRDGGALKGVRHDSGRSREL